MARLIAFYLPQYHPIPENDEWWGEGFTEWTNVTKARPLFPGHRQPDLPGELGFTDLRVPDTRAAQAALAAAHGIEAFCYWHYWFAGRRLLERPFAEVLSSGEPDLPFCLGWANQEWSGIWHGAPDRVLMEQTYPGPADDTAHFAALETAFHDPRYLRVDGRPLFYVYRPHKLPEPLAWVERWQGMAADSGLDGLYLVGQTTGTRSPASMGFDAACVVELPPARERRGHEGRPADWYLSAATKRASWLPDLYSYRHWAPHMPQSLVGERSHPCVMPNWDNTPRSGRRGVVYLGSTPQRFGRQLQRAHELVAGLPADEQIIFVKSWNEWAEGNHLEPCRRWGRAYLEVVRDVTMSRSAN